MDLNNLFTVFVSRCSTIKKSIRTKMGRNLFIISIVLFVLLFFAPLFQGAVGAALLGCVGAPMVSMIWRRFDSRHAVVPAVFFCIPMIADMLIYRSISVAACLLVAVVGTIATAIHPLFEFVNKIEDNLYAYLSAGGVCVAIVVLASLLILLVSIAWWIFCLILFFAIIALFFTVVLSSAAYTATDDKRQARKKQLRKENLDDGSYDFDVFAKDIGLRNELDPNAHTHTYEDTHPNNTPRSKKEPLFYDIDD